jgi:MGT family glycosyltransferase
MTRVLAYTSPARGHLYPLVPVLDELRARGHEVAVRTLPSEIEMLRERGLDAEPVSSAILAIEHDDWRARTPMAATRRALAMFAQRAPHEVADLREALDALGPDVLLVDVSTWGAAAVAEADGRPWAQWLPYPSPIPSRGVPPFGPGLRPASGALGRLRDRVVHRLTMPGFERALLPGVNEVRDDVGLEPLGEAAATFTRAPLTLYLTAEPFEYPRDWPSTWRLIGPGTWDPPAEAPAWLEDLDRPLVVVSTSSEFQDDGRLVTCALEALRDEDVFVVATLPSAPPPTDDVPPNARVECFLPHAPLIERAACVVCHAGMGITQKALAAGVPVCAVPFGRDQLEVARRVEVAEAGSRLPVRRLSPTRLRRAVLEALGRAEGAKRVARAFAAAGGPAAGADHVEHLVATPTPAGAR